MKAVAFEKFNISGKEKRPVRKIASKVVRQ
jgi:hypothetical protein